MCELYLDDLLVQSFCTDSLPGRLGVISEGGAVRFDDVHGWSMDV